LTSARRLSLSHALCVAGVVWLVGCSPPSPALPTSPPAPQPTAAATAASGATADDTAACAAAASAVERAYSALVRGDQRGYEDAVDTLLRSRPHHLMGEDVELLDMTYTVTDCRDTWAEVTIGGRIRLVGGPEDDVTGSIEVVHRVGDDWLVSTIMERENDPAWSP